MTTPPMIFDDRCCLLGEGPLWHPARDQLFWFDILGRRLMSRDATGPLALDFGGHVSASGWTGRDSLLVASETALFHLDLVSGAEEEITPLEADTPVTRSNDGRADPWGGFWIGTMGKQAEPGAGAIYRYYRGDLRQLFAPITIPNAICFSPDGTTAYFADTPTRKIWRQRLSDADGWPEGPPEVHIDLRSEGLNPDGAVVDRDGYLWSAQWGASRVARYSPEGVFDRAIPLPARQASCPAFGGPDLSTLYVTTAAEGLDAEAAPEGRTFAVDLAGQAIAGQSEHRVIL